MKLELDDEEIKLIDDLLDNIPFIRYNHDVQRSIKKKIST